MEVFVVFIKVDGGCLQHDVKGSCGGKMEEEVC